MAETAVRLSSKSVSIIIGMVITATLTLLVVMRFLNDYFNDENTTSATSQNFTKTSSKDPSKTTIEYAVHDQDEFINFVKIVCKKLVYEIAKQDKKFKAIVSKYKNDILHILMLSFFNDYKAWKITEPPLDWISNSIVNMSLDKIKRINLSNIYWIKLPKEAFSFFSEVDTLVMSNCGLDDKMASDIEEMSQWFLKLVVINLSQNCFSKMLAFEKFKSLTYIDLSNNVYLQPDGLIRLGIIKRLWSVRVHGSSKITKEDVYRLKRRYPDLQVITI